MKSLKAVLIISLFVALIITIRSSFAQKDTNKEFIPCLDSPSGYMPNPKTYPEFYDRDNPIHKAVVLHRRHLNCVDGSPYEPTMKGKDEQVIILHTSERDYCNYVCRNRKQEQCYDDGSFDTYYDEWCEDKDGNRIETKETVVPK